ncbi:MAG TPA: hypothetical protein VGK19_23725 [Capsulimonadaceae bacterium]|jgi:hypothetical protein
MSLPKIIGALVAEQNAQKVSGAAVLAFVGLAGSYCATGDSTLSRVILVLLIALTLLSVVSLILARRAKNGRSRVLAGWYTAFAVAACLLSGVLIYAHELVSFAMTQMQVTNCNIVEAWGRELLKSGKYQPTASATIRVYIGATGVVSTKSHPQLSLPAAISATHPNTIEVTRSPASCATTKLPCVEFMWGSGFGHWGTIISQEPLKPAVPGEPMPALLRPNVYYWGRE